MMRIFLFVIAYMLCNSCALSQKNEYRVTYLESADNPVFSARIFYQDSLIAVHDGELNERIYLDVLYADDANNYKAGQILFQEFGGRRTTLLELKSCAESSENGTEENAVLKECITNLFIENFQDLSPAKRANLITFINRNI